MERIEPPLRDLHPTASRLGPAESGWAASQAAHFWHILNDNTTVAVERICDKHVALGA
ncbi:Transposase (plasmid) [Mesorhizobium loti]|nr:Transposase [Mesorhizobium loti]